jgi:hypothetical protein
MFEAGGNLGVTNDFPAEAQEVGGEIVGHVKSAIQGK